MEKIVNLKSKHACHYKLGAFTLIELLFTLCITILSLSLLPNIIQLTFYYLHLAQDNNDLDYEFFSRDMLKDMKSSHHQLSIENDSIIKIKNKEEEIRYIYNNQKVYKNINKKGNITLLNKVVTFKIIKSNNNTYKIFIRHGDANNIKEKTLYL